MRRLFQELKRRNVYRVAATYAVVGFVVVQVADLVFPALNIPPWAYSLVVVLTLLGFPVALVLAWAFEMTPEGVRRTPAEVSGEEPGVGATDRSPASGAAEQSGSRGPVYVRTLVALIVLAAAAGGWYLVDGTAETEPEITDRSIAVLPFETLGQEGGGTFTEGIHGDILTGLATVSGLDKVTSRTSVMQFRDSDLPLPTIADSLGVSWVIRGEVQRSEGEIRVSARLVDARDDRQVWAEDYRRELTAANLFDLQEDITKRIARSLETELTTGERARVERRPTEDLEAYRLYVQGRNQLDTRTEAGMREAVDYFQRAISRDSSYALAWAGLADAVGLFEAKEYASPEVMLPDHERTARRALELGPDLAEAHASMGLVFEGPTAVRHLERAVSLKPGYAQAHHWLGWVQLNLGRPEDAREHLSLAVELNPEQAAARETLVQTLLARGDTEEARDQLDRFPTDYRGAADERVLVLYQERRWDDLRELSRTLLSEGLAPAAWWRFNLARVAVVNGDTALARQHLQGIREKSATPAGRFAEGLVHAALGDADSAFESWRGLDFEPWVMGEGDAVKIVRYWYSDILDPLREDPRYLELIRRINVGWGLNPDGRVPDSVEAALATVVDE